MAKEVLAIKVKIKIKTNGHAEYPDFNALQVVIDSGMDWSYYVDSHGLGWHYDKTSGLKDNTVDSPMGEQWGMLIVPEEFRDQALAMFPSLVTAMDETEIEDFYNNKAHAHEPDEIFNTEILNGIKLKQDLGLTLTQNQLDALDPNTDVPGIRKNKNKLWSDFKVKKDLTVKVK